MTLAEGRHAPEPHADVRRSRAPRRFDRRCRWRLGFGDVPSGSSRPRARRRGRRRRGARRRSPPARPDQTMWPSSMNATRSAIVRTSRTFSSTSRMAVPPSRSSRKRSMSWPPPVGPGRGSARRPPRGAADGPGRARGRASAAPHPTGCRVACRRSREHREAGVHLLPVGGVEPERQVLLDGEAGEDAPRLGRDEHPAADAAVGRSRPTSSPSRVIDPEVTGTSPEIAEHRVDLPLPLAPNSAVIGARRHGQVDAVQDLDVPVPGPEVVDRQQRVDLGVARSSEVLGAAPSASSWRLLARVSSSDGGLLLGHRRPAGLRRRLGGRPAWPGGRSAGHRWRQEPVGVAGQGHRAEAEEDERDLRRRGAVPAQPASGPTTTSGSPTGG